MDQNLKFKTKGLTEYYRDHIYSESGAIVLSRMVPLVIDLTNGEYDLQEVSKFLHDYMINDIVFNIDDAQSFVRDILPSLPFESFFGMTIRGNLEGLSLTNFNPYVQSDSKRSGYFEDLFSLTLEHTGDTPAHIDTISVTPRLNKIDLRNIESVQSFTTHPKKYFGNNPEIVLHEENRDLKFNGIDINGLDLSDIPRDLINFREIRQKYPKLQELHLGFDGEPREYEDEDEMIDEFMLTGHIKTNKGQLSRVREALIRYSKKHRGICR